MAELALVNFDRLIKRLQFNLQSAMSAVEPGEYKSTEGLESYINELKETIRKLEIAKEVAQKAMPTDEDVCRVMGITCYGNIGYCCGLAKECLWRDSCRQSLGIDDKNYVEIKESVIWQLLERTNKMSKGRVVGASRKEM